MMKRIAYLTAIGTVLALSAPVWAEDQPASAPKHVTSMNRTVEGKATVEAIDLATRRISLKNDEGKAYTIVADQRVKNLPQVHVGDVVHVKYFEAIAVDILPSGTPRSAVVEDAADTAKPGAKPAGAAGRRVTVVATIEAIDEGTQHVTLRGPEGNLVEVKARNPANLKKVKVGDSVQITYTEAVAISVRKAGS